MSFRRVNLLYVFAMLMLLFTFSVPTARSAGPAEEQSQQPIETPGARTIRFHFRQISVARLAKAFEQISNKPYIVKGGGSTLIDFDTLEPVDLAVAQQMFISVLTGMGFNVTDDGNTVWIIGAGYEVYINPNQLKGVPSNVVIELKKLGCLIPQGILDHTNVIEGEFAIPGQKDWAALCSTKGSSHIHIFWGGPNTCPSVIAERPDKDYLYKQSSGTREYYRGLGKVGEKFIMEHYEAYGGPKPPPITHDAIDDRWLEKASVFHYCHQGKWLELTGAD